MVFNELGEILGLNFKDDIDIQYLNIRAIEEEDRLHKEGPILHINLPKLSPEEQEAVLGLYHSQFENERRVLRLEEEARTSSMQRGYSEEEEEIVEYFEGFLSDDIIDILERSLYLRGLIEEEDLTKEEIQQKKRHIARRHGSIAIYLSSLVSAGYFDPDGGLRDLFVNLGINEDYDRYDFQDILIEYCEKRLLCVFVENDDSPADVTQDVKAGLARYQREEPIQEWFDIRGIGDGCAMIIDRVMENLEDEYMGIDMDDWRDEDDLWVRIYPRSVPTIS